MEIINLKGHYTRSDYSFKLIYFEDEKEYKNYMLQLILENKIYHIKLRGISSSYNGRLWRKALKFYKIEIEPERWFILERIDEEKI